MSKVFRGFSDYIKAGTDMKLAYLFVATSGIWFGVGLFCLLPQKLALLRRVGNVPNDELIRLAKAGDVEANRLHKRSWWWIGIGLALLLPQVLLLSLAKSQP